MMTKKSVYRGFLLFQGRRFFATLLLVGFALLMSACGDSAVQTTPTTVVLEQPTTLVEPTQTHSTAEPTKISTPTSLPTATPTKAPATVPPTATPNTPTPEIKPTLETTENWQVQIIKDGDHYFSTYYNPETGIVEKIVVPEIENLTIRIQEFGNQQIATWVDSDNKLGLKSQVYPYNLPENLFFESGTVAWHQPKGVTENSDGTSTKGFVVMTPSFQAQRQNSQTSAERQTGDWKIGLPITTKHAGSEINGEVVLHPYEKMLFVLEILLPGEGKDFIGVNPISGVDLFTRKGHFNDLDADKFDIRLENSGYIEEGRADFLSIITSTDSTFNPRLENGGSRVKIDFGEIGITEFDGTFTDPSRNAISAAILVGGNGEWEKFGTGSLDTIAKQTVVIAPSAQEIADLLVSP